MKMVTPRDNTPPNETGAFWASYFSTKYGGSASLSSNYKLDFLNFSSDRSVPTALENRPVSMSLYPCIRVS